MAHAGFQFSIVRPEGEEKINPQETPFENAKRLALEKALNVAQKASHTKSQGLVLGADTLVVLGQKIFGKPIDTQEAKNFLQALQNHTHQVITGYALVLIPDRLVVVDAVISLVTMKPLEPKEIQEYVATGEPMDKAGAYAAQGLGAGLIEKIEGSLSNVIGLPMEALIPHLNKGMKRNS